mgnify:CR=1 FL=1
MKFGMIVAFEKLFDPYFFFYRQWLTLKGLEITLKVGVVKHILLNTAEIIEDSVFVQIDEICVF